MGEFLVTTAILSLIVGALSFLSYPSENERAVRIALLVLLLYSVVFTATSFVSGVLDEGIFPSYGEEEYVSTGIYGEEYDRLSRESFALGIKRALSDKTGVDEECILVYLEGFDPTLMRAEKIEITLTGVGIAADFRGIEDYIEKNGLGECEVRIYAD